jgi:ATP-binding cassette subfamily F protein uup
MGTRFPTPYETYRQLRDELQTPSSPAPTKNVGGKSSLPPKPKPRRLTWKEKQELAGLEDTISNLTAQKVQLEADINNIGSDYERLKSLADQLETTKSDLETAELRWLELSEIAEAE